MSESPRDPVADLRRIAFLLERANEPTFRVKAFRSAAAVAESLPAAELAERAAQGTLRELAGIGEVTARCLDESLRGEEPGYLRRLSATGARPVAEEGAALRAALRGDCHTHSDWSDGGSPILEMALTARDLGHEYLALTDHSPRLKVARGLSAERLERQLDVVAELNERFAAEGGAPTVGPGASGSRAAEGGAPTVGPGASGSRAAEGGAPTVGPGASGSRAAEGGAPTVGPGASGSRAAEGGAPTVGPGASGSRAAEGGAPTVGPGASGSRAAEGGAPTVGPGASGSRARFRILTGIEVDILEDGTLDQRPSLLARLDLVVASVHSALRMPAAQMTPRMIAAVANPHTDILGHCTGRLIAGGRGRRPESEFDAELVLAACAQFGVAVEVNSRPERLDPPKRLLRLAVETGCLVSIDTDAHAPGQLDWQPYGCDRAADCGVLAQNVIDTWTADQLLAWTADHSVRP